MTSNLVYDLSQLPGRIQYSLAVVPPPSHLLLPSSQPLAGSSFPWLHHHLHCPHPYLLVPPPFFLLSQIMCPPLFPRAFGLWRCWHRGGCGREVTDPGEGMPAPSGTYFLETILRPCPTTSGSGMPLSGHQPWQHNREPEQWLDRT